MVSTCARIPRAVPDQVSNPTTTATTTMFGLSMRETTRIVNASEGTAISTSEKVRMIASGQPVKKPANRPNARPISTLTTPAITPTRKVGGIARIKVVKTSRPCESLPK